VFGGDLASTDGLRIKWRIAAQPEMMMMT